MEKQRVKMSKILFIGIFILLLGTKNVYAEAGAEDVAKIENTTYSSIDEAINAATENSEIVLLSDIDKVVIPKIKKITINMNNKNFNDT